MAQWVLNPNTASLEGTCGHTTRMYTLAMLGSNDSMYPESLDLHAASPLYQCPSLEDLDRRYLLVLVYTDVRGHPCVSVSCVAVALFGVRWLKDLSRQPSYIAGGDRECGALT